ncbi:recombinase family protein, partial [Streptomyces sp. NPDC088252]|uniref:recombinase family protein n=1 Tax=Streptomyces sp. NPDC088252 TaxID=3365845 RepID=UPI0037F6DC37
MSNALTAAIDAVARTAKSSRLRAVDYLRVSTAEQAKGFGVSYTGKKTKRHMEKKGWEYVRTYADEGYSGSLDHTQRPDLKTLMADARQQPRPFDIVVVPEERAIGRRDRAFWPWVWELEDLGIFVAIVRGDYDNTTEEGRSRMRKEQDKAEDERITIRDRTQGGVQEKAEMGGHPGGVAPYGYRIENQGIKGESRLVLDKGDEKAAYSLLHRAYTHIVDEGKNPGAVEDLFNAEGIHGPSKDYWPRGSMRHALTSRAVQTAKRVYRDPTQPGIRLDADGKPLFGETVDIELEPVFTELQLAKLNKALARTTRQVSGEEAVHPLSGHLFGICGSHYTGVSRVGRASVRAYRCTGTSNDYKNPKKQKCHCSQIDAEAVENRVWTEVCKLLEDSERLNGMANDWADIAKANGVDYEARILDLNSQIEELDDAIDVTMAVAARQAARKKLGRKEAEKACERAAKPLNDDRDKLVGLRDEAIAWRDEVEVALNRANDLAELANLARTKLFSMSPEDKAEVIHLLDLKVSIRGEIPRKTRSDDTVSAWFAERDRVVPLLTDEAWALVEPLFKARMGRKLTDPRGLLDSMLYKARTGCAWSASPVPGAPSIWARWVKSGFWEALQEALAASPGTPPTSGIVLPPLKIEGRIDPRLFIGDDVSPEGEGP